MAPVLPLAALLVVGLLSVGCVRTESQAASLEIPTAGTGTVVIDMCGTWLVGAVSPRPVAPSVAGLGLPRAGDFMVVEDGELVSLAGNSLLPAGLPDPDDWTVQNYHNTTTGQVGLYSVTRRFKPTGETAMLSVSLGSLDPDRMVGAVLFRFDALAGPLEERYVVLLQRMP